MLCSVSCDWTHQIFEFIYIFLYRLLRELCLFCSVNAFVAIVYVNINLIHILKWTNFNDWKENILIFIGCMDLDLALRTDQPLSLTTDSSNKAKKEFERWDRSNRMSLMIIKCNIPETFKGIVSREVTIVKEILDGIEKSFLKNDKVKTSTLLGSPVSMKY